MNCGGNGFLFPGPGHAFSLLYISAPEGSLGRFCEALYLDLLAQALFTAALVPTVPDVKAFFLVVDGRKYSHRLDPYLLLIAAGNPVLPTLLAPAILVVSSFPLVCVLINPGKGLKGLCKNALIFPFSSGICSIPDLKSLYTRPCVKGGIM